MSKKHHVIYIPGLDDSRKGYELLINKWKLYKVIPHVYRIGWKDEESFEPKLNKLVKYIDALTKEGDRVSLVGASAGGSAALNAYVKRPNIYRVVNLCGRLREGKNVRPTLEWASRKSIAFNESVKMFESWEPKMTTEQRSRVLTLTPLLDEIVPKTTVFLKGANNKTLFSIEHAISGFLGMTLFSPIIMRFLLRR